MKTPFPAFLVAAVLLHWPASRPFLVAAFVVSFMSALLPRAALGVWPHDPAINVPLSTATGKQVSPQIVSDDAGGAIVTWKHSGALNVYDVYTLRVLASGEVDPRWPVNGRLLCGDCAGDSPGQIPQIAPDGTGGAIVAWAHKNGNIYAHRVSESGQVDPVWPVGGRSLGGPGALYIQPQIAPDGAGGGIVTWESGGGAAYNIYAQHVLASGDVDPAWPPDALSLCTKGFNQLAPQIISDGAGGAIVTWEDYRSGNHYDIYAQRALVSGRVDPLWPANGRLLSTTGSGTGNRPQIAPDGAGGAIVTWDDPADIYAQRVLATGDVDPAWPPNGRALCTAGSVQTRPGIVSDGVGGAIVTWQDRRSGTNDDVYALRVLASGAVDPTWPANGRALCTIAGDQQKPAIATDGAGGAIVTWEDYRSGTSADIYARRVLASGIVDPVWSVDGRALGSASYDQIAPRVVADGAGGCIVSWEHRRDKSDSDIYAQNAERFGRLGNPAPSIISVADVLNNDQGGRVRIRWTASYLDTIPTLEIGAYGIWRQVTESAAVAAWARGARLLGDSGRAVVPGMLRATMVGVSTTYWEGVGTVLARGEPWYTFVAETFQDSAAGFNPHTAFMIDAHAAFLPGFWDSAPDSGYSVDNLAPATPTPFTGEYASGATVLHWGPNTEPDFAAYRLHRGTTPDFVPSAVNLVVEKPDTGYVDAGGQAFFYKLAAVDTHGNQSPFAFLQPKGTTGVARGESEGELWLGWPRPNPMVEKTDIHFALPRAADVLLDAWDVAGRRVRRLYDGRVQAGEHLVRFDLRDDAGRRLRTGLYFVRLEVEGEARTISLAVLK